MAEQIMVRAMRQDEWPQVGELIHASTNAWYERNRGMKIFSGPPSSCEWFCKVYEALDPGCCLVAQECGSGRLLGSSVYHPRPTHVSLGILNSHPSQFGRGVAARLLDGVIAIARQQGKPVRLVSSAMNLDSFSLYNRAGFVPRRLYQDMYFPNGLALAQRPELADRVRPATSADVPTMAALERELTGLDRQKDFAYFVRNEQGIWHTLLLETASGQLQGFLVSVSCPCSNMLGPGVMRDEITAAALIWAQINHRAGLKPVFLVPSDANVLNGQLYRWGARNCELHMHNVLGRFDEPRGVQMPTFLPETA